MSSEKTAKNTKGGATDWDNIFKIYWTKSIKAKYVKKAYTSILKRQLNKEITEGIEQTLQKRRYANNQDAHENVPRIMWKMQTKSTKKYCFTWWNGKKWQ